MSEELKTCPFCGGKAKMYEDITGQYVVQCKKMCGNNAVMLSEQYKVENRSCRGMEPEG